MKKRHIILTLILCVASICSLEARGGRGSGHFGGIHGGGGFHGSGHSGGFHGGSSGGHRSFRGGNARRSHGFGQHHKAGFHQMNRHRLNYKGHHVAGFSNTIHNKRPYKTRQAQTIKNRMQSRTQNMKRKPSRRPRLKGKSRTPKEKVQKLKNRKYPHPNPMHNHPHFKHGGHWKGDTYYAGVVVDPYGAYYNRGLCTTWPWYCGMFTASAIADTAAAARDYTNGSSDDNDDE